MELSRIGADLFGDAEAAVLRVLAVQGRPVSGREVGRLAGVNQSSARRALHRWVEVGLVTAAYSSHATLFLLNRSHVLWDPVEAVLASPSRIEQRIAELVVSRFSVHATAALFGSVARRESTASSDLDIAVIVPDRASAADRETLVDELRQLIESSTGNEAHIVELTRHELRAMVMQGDPLVASWAAESRTVTGPDLARSITEQT